MNAPRVSPAIQAETPSPAQPGRRRLLEALTMLVVSGLSLFLLLYVGFGEAHRTYQRFHFDKLAAQGRLVQSAMETYLRSGLPMKQFVGFASLAGPLVSHDSAIVAMAAFDRSGRQVFSVGSAQLGLLASELPHASNEDRAYALRGDGKRLQVVLPLRNKFEEVGSLAVSMESAMVTERVKQAFDVPLVLAAVLPFGFAVFIAFAGRAVRRGSGSWLQVCYAATFLMMAASVIATLVALYSEGAQARAKALADSLGQRLYDVVQYDLNLSDFEGLDRLFGEYRQLNPDISAAGLTIDGIVQAHTSADAVGRPWLKDRGAYEYAVDLTPVGHARQIRVVVSLPERIVWGQVFRSVKNFAALFVAAGFLAGLFLQLSSSMQRVAAESQARTSPMTPRGGNAAALNLVKPVFFVAVFLEHLTYSFLPQFVQQVTLGSGLSAGLSSVPFVAYYICFALILVPAAHVAQQYGTRLLIDAGLLVAAVGLAMLALPLDFYGLLVARGAAGIGQGMLFIGVQSYILAVASPANRTQAAGIIVFGFQGGMVSGTAIGSLLVIHMGPQGVFILAATIGLVMAFYTTLLVPSAARSPGPKAGLGGPLRALGRDIWQAGGNADFLKTIFLIGIPAKAVLTGVIIFALPLLLYQNAYAQEDIGQVIMLYAASVLIASHYAARLVDRIGGTDTVLFWGSIVSGIGLLVIGASDWKPLLGMGLDGLALIVGVVVVGLAHGFINAPVVTHVADLELARRIGVNSVTATYRFLERIGHAGGPMLVAQLLVLSGSNATVIGWIGGAIVLCSILFQASFSPPRPNAGVKEVAP